MSSVLPAMQVLRYKLLRSITPIRAILTCWTQNIMHRDVTLWADENLCCIYVLIIRCLIFFNNVYNLHRRALWQTNRMCAYLHKGVKSFYLHTSLSWLSKSSSVFISPCYCYCCWVAVVVVVVVVVSISTFTQIVTT